LETFNEKSEKKNVDGEEGDVGTKLADVSSNLLEFVLEWGDLSRCLTGDFHDHTNRRGVSNLN